MKHYPPYRFDHERYIKDAIEREFGHPATMQEGGDCQEMGGQWVYMVELSDPSKTEVFAWLKFPKVLMEPKGSNVTCAADALRLHADVARAQ